MTQVAPFFTEMEKFIADGRATVAAGDELSLLGLDNRIEQLCTIIAALSPEEQMMYEARLQDLLAGLNALGLELKQQFEGGVIVQHKNAAIAYQTADSRDNFGVREEE